MKKNDFREQDIEVAERESKCINTCLEATKQLIESGDYETAVKRAEEVLKSAKELDRLAIAKQQSDLTDHIVENFKSKGINVTKVVFS